MIETPMLNDEGMRWDRVFSAAAGPLTAAVETAGMTVETVEDEERTFYFRDAGQWIDWQASQGAGALIENPESRGADAVARFREAAVRETEKHRDSEGIPMLQRARFTLAKRTK